jgi:hypothetical protein
LSAEISGPDFSMTAAVSVPAATMLGPATAGSASVSRNAVRLASAVLRPSQVVAPAGRDAPRGSTANNGEVAMTVGGAFRRMPAGTRLPQLVSSAIHTSGRVFSTKVTASLPSATVACMPTQLAVPERDPTTLSSTGRTLEATMTETLRRQFVLALDVLDEWPPCDFPELSWPAVTTTAPAATATTTAPAAIHSTRPVLRLDLCRPTGPPFRPGGYEPPRGRASRS